MTEKEIKERTITIPIDKYMELIDKIRMLENHIEYLKGHQVHDTSSSTLANCYLIEELIELNKNHDYFPNGGWS